MSETYPLIPLTQGQFAIIDAADFDWLNQWKWYAKWNKGMQSYYARRIMKSESGKWVHVNMHNVIVCPRKGKIGDHISGNTLDNRRQNLREVTKRQNALNRRQRCDNTSGHKGVSWFKSQNRWRAIISVNRKPRTLGYFENIEDAVACRKAAERRYYGEFVRSTHLPPPSRSASPCPKTR